MFGRLKRILEAEPDNADAQYRLILEQSRVYGSQFLLHILFDINAWNKAPDIVQDLAIAEVARRLDGSFKFKSTRIWQCKNESALPMCVECGHMITAHRLSQFECQCHPYTCDCKMAMRYKIFRHRIATFVHTETGMEMNLLPGFTYGKPTGFCFCGDSIDQHNTVAAEFGHCPIEMDEQVWSNPFLIGRWPVTLGVIAKGIGPMHRDAPATHMRRRDWETWCQNRRLRFLTAFEWQYASQSQTHTRFYFGNDIDHNHVWYNDTYNQLWPEGHRELGYYGVRSVSMRIHEQKESWNPFGLVDMIGNVWEHVREGDDPLLFGGSFRSEGPDLLSDLNLHTADANIYGDCGFRAACSIPGVE